jgi:hypothetical protein
MCSKADGSELVIAGLLAAAVERRRRNSFNCWRQRGFGASIGIGTPIIVSANVRIPLIAR